MFFLRRTTVTVLCHENNTKFVLDPSQTRVVYFPRGGTGPHIIYLCPGCSGAHRAIVEVATLDQLRNSGAPSDWPVVPDNLADLEHGRTA